MRYFDVAKEILGLEEQVKRRKPGRPRGRRKEWAITPARQLGRVSDADWQTIRQACERAGMGLVEWALPTLLAKAKREGRQTP